MQSPYSPLGDGGRKKVRIPTVRHIHNPKTTFELPGILIGGESPTPSPNPAPTRNGQRALG